MEKLLIGQGRGGGEKPGQIQTQVLTFETDPDAGPGLRQGAQT